MGSLDLLPRDLRRRRALPARVAPPAPSRLGTWLRRTDPRPVVALGLIGLLVWSAVGFAVLGLWMPETSGAAAAGLWLAGVAVVAGVAASAALSAARAGPRRDDGRR